MNIPKSVGKTLLIRAATFNLIRETFDFGGGRVVPWFKVEHPGAASVLPVAGNGDLVLIRQYRPVVKRWLWEVPCGTLTPGESPRACAQRELAEEAGLTGRLRPLRTFFSAPGFCTERMYCYTADRLRGAPIHRDLDERIKVYRLPAARVARWVAAGRIEDAKTLVCLLAYFSSRASRPPTGASAPASRRRPRR